MRTAATIVLLMFSLTSMSQIMATNAPNISTKGYKVYRPLQTIDISDTANLKGGCHVSLPSFKGCNDRKLFYDSCTFEIKLNADTTLQIKLKK